MKIQSLDEKYLKGLVDMAVANYHEHANTIPAEINLTYSIEFGAYNTGLNMLPSTPTSAKITFHWIEDGEWVTVDEDTDSREYKGKNGFDHFTILAGERVVKLQMYVEEILDRLTA